jgi:hypothetical protein
MKRTEQKSIFQNNFLNAGLFFWYHLLSMLKTTPFLLVAPVLQWDLGRGSAALGQGFN